LIESLEYLLQLARVDTDAAIRDADGGHRAGLLDHYMDGARVREFDRVRDETRDRGLNEPLLALGLEVEILDRLLDDGQEVERPGIHRAAIELQEGKVSRE
jgi:hypothetical protein